MSGIEAILSFVRKMENWRIGMNNLTDFYVVAHSYGGYLMGTYASFYPQHIRKLVLVSPVGLAQKPSNYGKISRDVLWDGAPWLIHMLKDNCWGRIRPIEIKNRIYRMHTES